MSDTTVRGPGNLNLVIRDADGDGIFEPKEGDQIGVRQDDGTVRFGIEVEPTLKRLGLDQAPPVRVRTLRDYIARLGGASPAESTARALEDIDAEQQHVSEEMGSLGVGN